MAHEQPPARLRSVQMIGGSCHLQDMTVAATGHALPALVVPEKEPQSEPVPGAVPSLMK